MAHTIKELTFWQRITRGLLASSVLIIPTLIGVKFIAEPSSERFVASLTPEQRRVFEQRAPVTSKDLEEMIARSRSTHGRMTQKDFPGRVSYADQLLGQDPEPSGRTFPELIVTPVKAAEDVKGAK